MSCEQVRTRLADYSVANLYGWQMRRIQSHLAQCPYCQREWNLFQQVLSVIADLPERDAPPEMWSAIQQRLRQRESSQPKRAWQTSLSPPLTYAGAVAAVVVFGLATFSGYLNGGVSFPFALQVPTLQGSNVIPLGRGALPVTSHASASAVHVTDADIERLVKIRPRRPAVVPAGYWFEGTDLYRCNCCGHGGFAAILRYTNGTSWLYVLECRPDHANCKDPSHQDPATFGNPCLLCRLGKGSLVEAHSSTLRVAVIGDLPRPTLLAVAHSLKKK
ncbi:MAG: hypothetical protein NZT92_15175 [Abditibacteriales bacterium]|nr:hypothetical protein [Abditibacteriales bacterium]MDW8366215.1 hypothetical protein [Abditibacteriales bacterium]